MPDNSFSGFGIALAWPQTYCKQAGGWYDTIMSWLGFNQGNYYRAGHAAMLLVEETSGQCHYFDFGRYHAPYQQGRVRSALTDPELKMRAVAVIRHQKIQNLQEILEELSQRKACHGSGSLYASVCKVNFHASFAKALQMQQQSPLPYGPFVWRGTNCSRFVHSVLLAGICSFQKKVGLYFPFTITPAPMSNVWALGNIHKIAIDENIKRPVCKNLKEVMPAPARPVGMPKESIWLSGEGAGSWFLLGKEGEGYTILRFDEEGALEYRGRYQLLGDAPFDPSQVFELQYLTHYQAACIFQHNQHLILKLVLDYKKIYK